MSECSDPEPARYPWRRVCYDSMATAAAEAMYAELHEDEPYHNGTFTSWAAERSPSHPYHFNEGVTIGVSDTDPRPWDKFTTERNASPIEPEQSGVLSLARSLGLVAGDHPGSDAEQDADTEG